MMRGFTLIEVMIVAAIGAILLVLVSSGVGGGSSRSMSFGYNGVTETRCISGYQFVVGSSGSAQQVLGPNGGGVPCR